MGRNKKHEVATSKHISCNKAFKRMCSIYAEFLGFKNNDSAALTCVLNGIFFKSKAHVLNWAKENDREQEVLELYNELLKG